MALRISLLRQGGDYSPSIPNRKPTVVDYNHIVAILASFWL
jgi:hypothetical protein